MRLIFFISFFILLACGENNAPEADKEVLLDDEVLTGAQNNDVKTTLKTKEESSSEERASQISNLEEIQKSFQKEINSLLQTINSSIKDSYGLENITSSAPNLYQQEIAQSAIEHLRSKYSRAELGLLESNAFIPSPVGEPYEFISSDGEFLDKNKALYEKLRGANPYHEQGRLARECGLKKIIQADKEFAGGEIHKAGEVYNSAEALSIIVSGELPLAGLGRTSYESCTEKNLFTGLLVSTL